MPMVRQAAHVVALKANGTVWTWVIMDMVNLVTVKNRNTNIPVQVLTGAQDSNSGYLENIIQVAAVHIIIWHLQKTEPCGHGAMFSW